MANGEFEKKFEKKMEFILEQQAQFSADIQQLREAQARTEQALAQTEQLVTRLVNVTFEGFKDVNAKIDALVDSQMRLSEAQSRTDENLRNLIAVVDRYFRERRNGESGP